MKKKVLFSLLILISLFSLFIFPPLIYATSSIADIAGWWKMTGRFDQGDLVTGEFKLINSQGTKASFLYIETTTSDTGTGYFIEWDDESQGYLLRNIFAVYIKNDSVVMSEFGGIPTSWATMIFRAYSTPFKVVRLRGNYTLYVETAAEQIARFGSLSGNKVTEKNVPSEVMDLVF